MFEHIVLRRSQDGLPITAGQIAEALLYYQKVQLFIDRGTLFKLIQQIGPDRILSLLKRPDLSAVYCEENLATHTSTEHATQFHKFVTFSIGGNQDSGKLNSPAERLQFELERQNIKKNEAKHFIKKFLDLVPIRKLSGNHFLEGGVTDAAKRDIFDKEFISKAIRQSLIMAPGGYDPGEDLKLETLESNAGICIFSNIDLNLINQKRCKTIPALEPLTIAHILSEILNARADLALSSFYGGDFVTSQLTSSIIQVRYSELLRRSKINIESRKQFIEMVLPDSPSLAEVIDSEERSFDEFLKLIDDATRFKNWLGSINPDENIIRTYMREISSKDWIERLPSKTLRYILNLGIEAGIGPTAGVVTGLVDNFIVEKLFAGWRPNHFIDRKLKPFTQAN